MAEVLQIKDIVAAMAAKVAVKAGIAWFEANAAEGWERRLFREEGGAFVWDADMNDGASSVMVRGLGIADAADASKATTVWTAAQSFGMNYRTAEDLGFCLLAVRDKDSWRHHLTKEMMLRAWEQAVRARAHEAAIRARIRDLNAERFGKAA